MEQDEDLRNTCAAFGRRFGSQLSVAAIRSMPSLFEL